MNELDENRFAYRMIRSASLLWILTAQCLVVQGVVQSAWTTPFSLNFNTLSDLGATQCREARTGPNPFVCSPWHGVMDASFVVFGLMWAVGAMLLKRASRFPFDSNLVSVPLAAAGIGAIFVGFFPEDGISILHSSGATIELLGGVIGFVSVGRSVSKQGFRAIGTLSVAIGILSLVAFVLFLLTYQNQSSFLGLRLGGWERIAYWSQNVWLVGAGVWVIVKQHVESGR